MNIENVHFYIKKFHVEIDENFENDLQLCRPRAFTFESFTLYIHFLIYVIDKYKTTQIKLKIKKTQHKILQKTTLF